MTAIKRLIRNFVITTSFTPFLQFYRSYYTLVMYLTIRVFKKYPSIKSVYLRRGGAKGEILPLISDLDFAVIVKDMEENERKEVIRDYERLAHVTTILDESLEMYEEDTLSEVYYSGLRPYRFMEGKATWKLMYGRDYIAELPTMPIEKMYSALYLEIKVWWDIFRWQILESKKYWKDLITKNVICYKVVSEILKATMALDKNILTFSRDESLKIAEPYLDFKDKELIEKLKTIKEHRFSIKSPDILNETKDFLFTYLNCFFDSFRSHRFSSSIKEVSQKIDYQKDERLLNNSELSYIEKLIDCFKNKWEHSYRGSYLVSGICCYLDECLLMIKVDPKVLPTINDLFEFHLMLSNIEPLRKSRIYIYLLYPNAAFYYSPSRSNGRGSFSSILTPSCNPDVFTLLGKSENIIEGEGYASPTTALWSPVADNFVKTEFDYFKKIVKGQTICTLNGIEFLRIFWKIIQMKLITSSLEKGIILYPLTLPAIDRAMAAESTPFPTKLQHLKDAYYHELQGKSYDIATCIPDAIAYLKNIME